MLSRASGEDLQNEFILSGIIDKFMLQFEMGWKLFQAALRYEGDTLAASGSPRAIIKEAYKYYSFLNEDVWLEMLNDRNDATHIYDGEAARKLTDKIIGCYIQEFLHVQKELLDLYGDRLHEF